MRDYHGVTDLLFFFLLFFLVLYFLITEVWTVKSPLKSVGVEWI